MSKALINVIKLTSKIDARGLLFSGTIFCVKYPNEFTLGKDVGSNKNFNLSNSMYGSKNILLINKFFLNNEIT
jgi:hypothetical protein